ncbi:MAG: DUF4197 domain-containing protein [Spirochaetales bacterium]|nr:DUF4197 domain-containing protein [Spirochaetales bacterium]
MKIIIGMAIITCLFFSFGCKGLDSISIIKSGSKDGLDEKTVIAGLKEALEIGTKNTVTLVSKKDGYFKNLAIKILVPEDLKKVAKTVRDIGLGSQVDKFIQTMNRAAEKAAPKAVDIFIDVITKMTIKDALRILHGSDDEATRYFEKNTRTKLYNIFKPIVKKVMDDVGVTAVFKIILDAYNNLPYTKRVSFDLDDYVTNEALDGLFLMIAKEEKKIRKDPAARVTELLRKVFGSL